MAEGDSTRSNGELWNADTTPASDRDLSLSDTSGERLDEDAGMDAELRKGAFVGRYQIIERLGAGGMGVVYRAHDPQLDREVALKLLRSAYSGEQVAVSRMLREAKSAAKIRHPNVVTVYDAGQVDGHVFIAMELMRGTDLGKWFDRRPPWHDVVRVMLQAAHGLRAAHEAGLIHRDFKPDNVVLEDDGNVKVLDFGLARMAYDVDAHVRTATDLAQQLAHAGAGKHDKLTRTGAMMGTLAYMAPEQYQQQTLDARTDQFSFCVTLFMGVYGYRPFGGITPQALKTNVLDGNIEDPEHPTVAPAELLETLRKGLATDPNARHSSMDELIAELQRILHAGTGKTGGSRMPGWALMAGFSLVAVVAAGLIVNQFGSDDVDTQLPIETTAAPEPPPDQPKPSVDLAAGRGRSNPRNGPQIWISTETTTKELVEAFAAARLETGENTDDPVTLYVDRQTPFSTILSTIHSGQKAGFMRYDFAVLTDGETRVLEIQPQIRADEKRRVALELGIQRDRVRVGARAWASDDPQLNREPMRWPLDAGAGTCERPASPDLESLGQLGTQLCQLDAVSVAVIVGADDDVPWEQVANILGAALPSTQCPRDIVIESGMPAMPDCATPIAMTEVGTRLAGASASTEQFRRWCFINSSLRSKKVCRPTQAACIAEAAHWVDHPRRSCRGEQ
jgi:serine/threonine protein kinase